VIGDWLYEHFEALESALCKNDKFLHLDWHTEQSAKASVKPAVHASVIRLF
jgi:hypothetical protein